jgi:NAD(P)H dehydrogenase (quinone)
VESWISHYTQIATGEMSTVSDTVPRLTGHKAQSLAEYLQTHPESYRHLQSPKS